MERTRTDLARLSQISERMLLAFFVIVALVSGVRGLMEWRRVQHFATHAVAGEATILECTAGRRSPRVVYEYNVPDAQGTPQRYVAGTQYHRCLEGATLPMRYLPADPTQTLLEGDALNGELQTYGIVFLGALGMVAWVPLSRRWKRQQEGQGVVAEESAPLE